MQFIARDAAQQTIEQLDWRGFVAMDAGRQQQVEAIVARCRRCHLQRTFVEPAQTRTIGRQLNLRRRLVAGQGQFKQFAEGKHGDSLVRSISVGWAEAERRPAHPTRFNQWLQSGP